MFDCEKVTANSTQIFVQKTSTEILATYTQHVGVRRQLWTSLTQYYRVAPFS